MEIMKYKITFDRIGRNRSVPDIEVEGTEEDILDAVLYYANGFLASREFGVSINLDTGQGRIDGGRFGEFTLKELDGAS